MDGQEAGVPRPCPELDSSVSPLAGAIDLAAKSAGIIPGGPLPVLDTEGLSSITPLASSEVTVATSGRDSGGMQADGDCAPAAAVSGSSLLLAVPLLGLEAGRVAEADPGGVCHRAPVTRSSVSPRGPSRSR